MISGSLSTGVSARTDGRGETRGRHASFAGSSDADNTLDNADPNGTAYTGVSNFFTTDARVRYEMLEHVTASLSVDNVNRDRYWNFHPYPQTTVAAELDVQFRSMECRSASR